MPPARAPVLPKRQRREAMGTLIATLSSALAIAPFRSSPQLKLIGNGAAARDRSARLAALTEIDAVKSALTGGCLAEQIFCDTAGKALAEPDSDRIAGMEDLPPQKRWLVEIKGSARDVRHATNMARSEHMRLFIAENVNYAEAGELINPDNFRVIYNKVRKLSGAGVGDLITDPTETSKLSAKSADKPRRVWLYVCIGEVERNREHVFPTANAAGLVCQDNNSDPTGNTNVRFWDPAWARIVLDEMARSYRDNCEQQYIAGFMLDVCDSWTRDSSVWQQEQNIA